MYRLFWWKFEVQWRISLKVNKIFESKFGNSKFKSNSMQFQELIQSSLTNQVNTALKYFLQSSLTNQVNTALKYFLLSGTDVTKHH